MDEVDNGALGSDIESEGGDAFAFEEAMTVKWRNVKATINIIRVDGAPFFHLQKTNAVLNNILQCKVQADAVDEKKRLRIMPRTNIVEQITQLRDDEFLKLTKGVTKTKKRRYSARDVRAHILSLPQVMSIDVPSQGEIDGITMNVKCTKPTSRLFVELIDANLQFVTAVVAKQVADGNIHRKHPRESVPEAEEVQEDGVSCSYSKASYRGTVKDPNGKVHSFFVPWSKGKREAKEKAIGLVNEKLHAFKQETNDITEEAITDSVGSEAAASSS